jgi:hypothetical protein
MRVVVGVFKSRSDARAGSAKLAALGIKKDKIHVLTPEATEKELAAVPTMEAEQPGIIKALGAVVGGAVGFGVVEALSASLIPGVGPVLAIGLAGGTLLGALSGGTAGGAIESKVFDGLPEGELFVYEDALRQGHTVVIASPEDETQAEAARGALEYAGAETIDRAHEKWWLGMRDVEKEKYEFNGWNFAEDERYFRAGFEAALHSKNRDKSYEEFRPELLASLYSVTEEREAFRRGYDGGRAYRETLRNRQN